MPLIINHIDEINMPLSLFKVAKMTIIKKRNLFFFIEEKRATERKNISKKEYLNSDTNLKE
tara:strand:+ start:247 stop:429 length:183 start_codon:yes stop_codon:yes gene_type:complete